MLLKDVGLHRLCGGGCAGGLCGFQWGCAGGCAELVRGWPLIFNIFLLVLVSFLLACVDCLHGFCDGSRWICS